MMAATAPSGKTRVMGSGADDTDSWRVPDDTIAIEVVDIAFQHGHLAAGGEAPRADIG